MKTLSLLLLSQFASAQNFWQKISTPEYSAYVILITDDNRIYIGTYNGVYISTDDGYTWTQSNNGMGDAQIYSLAEGINNEIYAGANFSGLFVSSDYGMSWQNLGIPDNYINCILVTNESQLLVGTYRYLV